MINMMGAGLVWPTLPSLVSELTGGTISQTAAIYGATAVIFSLMQFIFAPLMGALSDRYGRRRVMLVALTGLGFDNILLALAPTIGWMFIGRAVGGILGATISTANAYIADTTEAKDRAAAFGMIGAAFGVGFIIGPILGGFLGSYDLRLPFYCAAALSFGNAIFGYFYLEESLPEDKRDKSSLKRANPFGTLKLLTSTKVLMLLGIALMLVSAMQRGLEALWVIFSELQYGWNSQETGFSLAVVGASYVFVQGYLVRKVIPKFGEINTIIGGFLLSSLMYVMLAFNTNGLLGYLGIIPYIIGWGCAQPALQAIASRQVSDEQQGLLQGSLTSVGGLAAIVGPALSTTSFSYFTSSIAPVYFPGAFFLFGAFVLIISAWIGVFAGRADAGTLKNTSA
jgi:DHA1 family tetracycline resistance protein-like MFS transporter